MQITSHPLRGDAATSAVRRAMGRDASFHLRLLEPDDAAFVDTFRPSPAGRRWIEHYKFLEAEGREFYFVIVADGQDRGLVRMHDFAEIAGEASFGWGDWVAQPPRSPDLLTATALAIYRLGFDTLGFARAHMVTAKSNPGLLALHLEMGADLEYDDEVHAYLRFSAQAHDRLRNEARLLEPA